MSFPQFEPGDTRMFTWTSSVAPDAAPTVKVEGITQSVIASITAQQSDTTHYYALYTFPTSEGLYVAEWFAQKTFNSSVRNKVDRFPFLVSKTKQP